MDVHRVNHLDRFNMINWKADLASEGPQLVHALELDDKFFGVGDVVEL